MKIPHLAGLFLLLTKIVAVAQIPNVEWKKTDGPQEKSPSLAIREKVTPGPFQPTWESLANYQCPDWYRDAKFGIFLHWSINSVVPGGNDGWYGRQMYMQTGAPWGNAYSYHVKTYGHPSVFGYKDLMPLWKAEKFDPTELVNLFKKAGARYIVPVAVHHDNFDNYASSHQPWNSVNMGPHRDLIGAWEKATRAAGLKFGASSHSDRAWGWYEFSRGSDSDGDLKGVPYDGVQTKADGKGKWWEGYDPEDLYGPVRHSGGDQDQDPSAIARYSTAWVNRTLELVNKYKLDLLYFDGGMPMGDLGLKVTASLYNNHITKGKTESVLNIKWNPPRSACVEDLEKGLSNFIRPQPWQLDASINNMWFTDNLPLELSSEQIVHTLVDCASKNGNLLLNVALHADGTTDPEERRRLLEVGAWLTTNGQAIYGTRPTHLSGEGPTFVKNWLAVDKNLPAFTSEDVRFTAKGDTLYAVLMRRPSGTVHIQALRSGSGVFDGKIKNVTLLGNPGKLTWIQDSLGLHVTLPAPLPGDSSAGLGAALEISGLTGLTRDGMVRPQANGDMLLNCWDAKITGNRLAPKDYEPALCDWNNSADFATWDLVCPTPGTYTVQAWYATDESSEAVLETPWSTDLAWSIEPTKDYKTFRLATLGEVKVAKAGRYSVSLKPVSGKWRWLNLSYLLIKNPVTTPSASGELNLPITAATLNGTQFFLQQQGGATNLGGWKSPAEWVEWGKARFAKAGRYTITILGAAGDGSSGLDVTVGDATASCMVDATENWDKLEPLTVGEIEIKAPGDYPIEIHPTSHDWRAINLAKITFVPSAKP